MLINTKEIFKRMDLQNMRAFILEGLDPMEIHECTYEERIEKGNAPMLKRLREIYENDQEFSDAADDFYHALIMCGEAYTEIGMKAGARLLFQLLCDD